MPSKETLTAADARAIMIGVGYTDVADLPSGTLYKALAYGGASEYFLLACPEGGTIETNALVQSLEYLGVPLQIIYNAIDELG